MAYTAVAVIFGLLAVVTGIITCFAALRDAAHRRHLWMLLTEGLVITSGGIVVILLRSVTALEVIRMIAVASLLFAAFQFATATHVRRHVKDEWFLIAGGMCSLAFSVFLLLDAGRELALVLKWIAIYAAVNGLAMIGLAQRLYRLRRSIHDLSSPDHLKKGKRTAGAA
ncbi:MAG: HdeD family acid-resistance protein [Actinomycetota bacterium]